MLSASVLDGKVELWDAAHAYTRLTTLDTGQTDFQDVVFSPEGSTLAAARGDGKVLLTDVLWESFAGLESLVCGLVSGNLDNAEWDAVAPGLAYHATCAG